MGHWCRGGGEAGEGRLAVISYECSNLHGFPFLFCSLPTHSRSLSVCCPKDAPKADAPEVSARAEQPDKFSIRALRGDDLFDAIQGKNAHVGDEYWTHMMRKFQKKVTLFCGWQVSTIEHGKERIKSHSRFCFGITGSVSQIYPYRSRKEVDATVFCRNHPDPLLRSTTEVVRFTGRSRHHFPSRTRLRQTPCSSQLASPPAPPPLKFVVLYVERTKSASIVR